MLLFRKIEKIDKVCANNLTYVRFARFPFFDCSILDSNHVVMYDGGLERFHQISFETEVIIIMAKKSIQTELTAVLIVVAFLGMTAVFVLSYLSMRGSILAELLAKTRNMADVEAQKINLWFAQQITFTETVGTSLTQISDRDLALQMLVQQEADMKGDITVFIGLSDDTGIFSKNAPNFETWKATQRGWYRSAMAGKGNIVITAPYKDTLTNPPATVITITKDIGKFSDLEAAVGIDVDVQTVIEAIEKVETQGGYAFLVNQTGLIVAHPDEKFNPKGDDYVSMADNAVYATIFPAKEPVYSITDYDGVKRYIFPCEIPSSGWVLYAAIPHAAVAKTINPDITTLISAVAFLLVAAVVVSLIVRFNVVKPLVQVVEAGSKIAHGDLDIALRAVTKNELGQLAEEFRLIVEAVKQQENVLEAISRKDFSVDIESRGPQDTMNTAIHAMVVTINNVFHEIDDNVGRVATGSHEVSNAAQALSSGAQESAASLEEITASMSAISGQTKQNAESATRARDLAQKASKAATDGQGAMQEMTIAMDRITQNSSEIQRVIKVIDDIAFQTNLLALNAAVEAARAGQHGKGFAVVAEEVRNLASRSAKAARETSELIAKSGHEIEQGGAVATRTAEVLNTIVEHVTQTTDLVAGIAVASNEQAQGVNQITIGLQQIDAVTQQNTASAEESASAANEMTATAANLQKLLAQFKLR